MNPENWGKAVSRLLPHSLYWQFVTAISSLALMILSGGFVALDAMRDHGDMARQLAEERLARMQEAQNLVRHAFLVERESYRLIAADSLASMRDTYGGIVENLDRVDRSVNVLAAASDDLSILSLHQTSQIFRNMLHVVAALYERSTQAADGTAPAAETASVRQQLGHFHGELQKHTLVMVSSSQELSSRISEEYRDAIGKLAERSRQHQFRLAVLLAGSLLFAGLLMHYFLVRHVLRRLESVSRHLRSSDEEGPAGLPVAGDDEIAHMARAVEQFLADRRVLAVTNEALYTERERLQELFREVALARDQAETANRAKSDFVATVSHELRTPLTLILAPLEQLATTAAAPADWKSQVERAQRNALLLMNRVNDILDFSKAEAGKFELCPEPVDLPRMVEVLSGDAGAAAALKGVALACRVDPALGTVCLDPGHFEKIVLNLIGNALKFTPAGGRIAVTAAALPEGRFEFAVEDSGIGIPADRLPLLFQRFSQVDASATRRYGGTGLGLALVKELASLMGGEVGVDSEPGRGSRFFVRLPLQAGQAACAPGEAPLGNTNAREAAQRRLRFGEGGAVVPDTAPGAAAPREGGALPRVLVVEDNPEMLAYLEELLSGDYAVATAGNGEAAWALLQRHPVDVVVSDVMMPELDGFGLTARIKASPGHAHLPVILLTARGGSEASVSGLQAGADDYVAKPFSPAELEARVRAALRMARIQGELRDQSRRAGMAEIAANVLHNVGNVLNSVNVSATVVRERLRASRLPGLAKAVQLMQDQGERLPAFLAEDERGRRLPAYLEKLAETLAEEQQGMAAELRQLTGSVDHIKEVIATQQSYAGSASLIQLLSAGQLVEDALRMQSGSLDRHAVTVVREFSELPLLPLDRSRLLQILVNLISNAKQAMKGDGPHRLTLGLDLAERIEGGDDAAGPWLRIRVADDGEGIAPENLTRIFTHGFTTRKEGHGFGLHSCAIAAREMGGRLAVHSEGVGRGTVFTLEIPVTLPAAKR